MSKAKFGWRERACALVLLCAAATIAAPAQTFKTLANFDGTDGEQPLASLVQGTDGNLYGTTSQGGANSVGTMFKVTPAGTLTTLYSFCAQTGCPDGETPVAGLLLATDGNFYGTTPEPSGTVFKITPRGTLTTLYTFCVGGGCPSIPDAALVQATDGNFYGTTYAGGANNSGTVFKITPRGTFTMLYSFCAQTGCPDGGYPIAGLVQASDGNFYGATIYGGANNAGTVFKITPRGTLTTLYSFCGQTNCADGASPYAALVQATDGNLYGTTIYGGTGTTCGGGCGTVFKITSAGALTTLHSFDYTDGYEPVGVLVQATDGNFYGTTDSGGINYGTVFKITSAGALTTLHSFDDADGSSPFGGLSQATNGTFYGLTQLGGSNSDGTVFSLAVGLGPFVETVPASGKVGAAVKILGTNLTGATSVTFNGTAATFTVVSRTLITTPVPAGATTGKVQVTTPHGTLLSNVPFRVLP